MWSCRSPGWRPGRRLLDLCRLLGLGNGLCLWSSVVWCVDFRRVGKCGLQMRLAGSFLVRAGGVKLSF